MKQVLNCPECGKPFWPRVEGQRRCYECIMASPPPEPSADCTKESTKFVEWFIYRWNCIKAAAGVKKSASAAAQKQSYVKRKYKKKKGQNVKRLALERGLDPNKVYARLRRGWSLKKALEVEE